MTTLEAVMWRRESEGKRGKGKLERWSKERLARNRKPTEMHTYLHPQII